MVFLSHPLFDCGSGKNIWQCSCVISINCNGAQDHVTFARSHVNYFTTFLLVCFVIALHVNFWECWLCACLGAGVDTCVCLGGVCKHILRSVIKLLLQFDSLISICHWEGTPHANLVLNNYFEARLGDSWINPWQMADQPSNITAMNGESELSDFLSFSHFHLFLDQFLTLSLGYMCMWQTGVSYVISFYFFVCITSCLSINLSCILLYFYFRVIPREREIVIFRWNAYIKYSHTDTDTTDF